MKAFRLSLLVISTAVPAEVCAQQKTSASAATPPGPAAVNEPGNAELQPLQGTWEGVMVGDEAKQKITITITGNSLYFHRDKGFWFETTLTLIPGTKPQLVHAKIERGSNSIGEVVVVIFKIENGTLTLATDNGAGEALKVFETAPNRYELRKVEPQKKETGSRLDSLVLEGPEWHAPRLRK